MSASKAPLLSPSDFSQTIHPLLAQYLDTRLAEISPIGKPVEAAVSYLQNFILGGGKRIRPLYGWAGFVGAGGLAGPEDPQAVLKAVSALEFIQACALIHDDIIDTSDTRRGNPTVHKAVEAQHKQAKWHGDSAHFGHSVAILVGDLATVWADDMLYDAGLSAAALHRLREPWKALRSEVIGGQLLDITLEAHGSEEEALANNVNRFKTAAYTIERPLHMGAAIAGASPATIAAFRGYGRDIGIAFQLRDDLLGVFGDPEITGKPAGDDLRDGKRTVLLSLALKHADATDPVAAKALRTEIGVVQDPERIAQLSEIIVSTGAAAEVENRITSLVESGLRHLQEAALEPEVVELLERLAISSTQRRH
ncbi:polyprenyl synthetase family protein [Corynebacterium caspium]|uniref:polyprenyl synthetase family protein n=1 Tax=Corynebacterium caspium TaxID=234828 RepID=UPI0003803F24|nr:polyprenyl synthetase family protein [Corynebacterium caspium]WKD58983.1 (2E,6E)-farnesyl diphosphate synthase [Corynebacterium caspium DSM 44850]